jgi:WD40 repeat protein
LDKRKFYLQYFLQYCINRKDLLLNNDFTDFLELKKNSPELIGNNIEIIGQYNHFNLSVSNFILCKNKNILIISFYDNDYISRDEILLENVLEIKNNTNDSKKMLGCVIIYEITSESNDIETNSELLEKNKLWEKYLLMQIKTIFFDEKKEILCIGADDGGIFIYKTKSNGDFKEMEALAELTFHTDKVSGLILNSDEMNLYSCSYDNMFFVTNLNEIPFSKSLIYNNISGFTGLEYIKKYNIFITSDEDGIISLYSYEKLIYRLSLSLQTTSLDKINVLNSYDNYIITGGNNGKVCIIDISQIKEQSIREIMSLDIGKFQIMCIAYNPKNEEIIIGDENGRIIIWNNKIKKYIY